MTKLYEIREEIEEALVMDDEEFDPAVFNALKLKFEDKLEGCAGVIKNLNAESASLAAEIKNLQGRKNAVDNNVHGLKQYVKRQIERINAKKIDAGIHKFRIQRNSAPSVEVLDQRQIDEDYLKVTVEVDKRAIANNFKDTGEEVEGTRISVGTHLRVS